MQRRPEAIDQGGMRCVAQWFAARVDADRKLQAYGREQDRRLLDRDRVGHASLDPTVLSRRDADRARNVGPAETSVKASVA
jgi:hypothetical protein